MGRPTRFIFSLVAALVAFQATHPSAQREGSSELDRFLATDLLARPADIARIHEGRPYVTPLPAAVDREIVVAGIVRIDAPPERTVAVIQDIEKFEAGGGFLQTRRLSEPPVLDDFAAFQVDAEDVAALRKCRPGHCDVKLGRGAFPLLDTINWSAPNVREQVNVLARRTAFDYVQAYRRGGNDELAVYSDAARPTFVAHEFADMIQRTTRLPEALPDLTRFLLEYPTVADRAAFDDFYYWSVADFGLKPVFRLNHVVIHRVPRPSSIRFAIATKQLYANHYFHTALEIRALIDATADSHSHYLLSLSMARSDGLTGLFGGLVKSKAQTGAREGMIKGLTATREAVERLR